VGTSVARDNRLANSGQTHFFDFGSGAAVDRKLLRVADAKKGFRFAGSLKGEEGGKTVETTVALGERARRGVADIAIVRRNAPCRRP